ncbi:MAG TPA: glycoside hydrolase family 15 protein, partial [Lapillicoccus sp.]|nr:glycoside hydrolase family 15 protein [Lapillicoccus sp.]
DYRYTWIRDSTLTLWAMARLGFDWEADDFFSFIADVAGIGDDIQIMYGVDGERELSEEILDHLDGYMHSRPIRIGNGAYDQKQHDVWGAILDSVWVHKGSRDRVDDRLWTILARFVDAAVKNWSEPDRGIWEVRGEPQHFTSSKIMCWVAADRGAKLARAREEMERADAWQAAADEMKADILANGVDDRGVFTQYYGTTALDASTLLIPLVGFLPVDDERIRNTVHAIAEELTEDGLVLRYRVEHTDDGLSGEEGTFTICSFWLVSAYALIGEVDNARRLCEKLFSMASPLGLYAEEIDAASGRHLGNFPQAFTHLGLINAVLHIMSAEEKQRS